MLFFYFYYFLTMHDLNNILTKFNNLDSLIIDASSIIYLNKLNILSKLQVSLLLLTIQEIIEETGIYSYDFKIIDHNIKNKTNDEKLIILAINKRIPVISDDKKILLKLKKNNIDYYNSIMMLNFLYYKNEINIQEYKKLTEKLKNFAWYSKKIITYSEYFFNYISSLKQNYK